MEDVERFKLLGERFKERLPDQCLKSALDYIDFNEVPLALDILCEYDIDVTEEEYKEIVLLNSNFRFPLGKKTLSYLKGLISVG